MSFFAIADQLLDNAADADTTSVSIRVSVGVNVCVRVRFHVRVQTLRLSELFVLLTCETFYG